jgi:ATP-dependent Zn protease
VSQFESSRVDAIGLRTTTGAIVGNDTTLVGVLVNWFPMLLLVAVWIFFMNRGGSPAQTALAEQKRHNEALEKILRATRRVFRSSKTTSAVQFQTETLPSG